MPTEAPVQHTDPPIPLAELPNVELMRMMCCCLCNTLSTVSDKSQMRTFADLMALEEKCLIIAEFLSRPNVVRSLIDDGWEVYQFYRSYGDRDIMTNASGFGKIMRLLCPDVFVENAKEAQSQ